MTIVDFPNWDEPVLPMRPLLDDDDESEIEDDEEEYGY
jgi:hypothetical protein